MSGVSCLHPPDSIRKVLPRLATMTGACELRGSVQQDAASNDYYSTSCAGLAGLVEGYEASTLFCRHIPLCRLTA